MEQRDYIIREIEKIGQMILGIIGKLGTKTDAKEFQIGLTLANLEFEKRLGASISMIVKMDQQNLNSFLKNNPELDISNQESLADLLRDIGEKTTDEPIAYFQQALKILKLIDQGERTFSLERSGKAEYLTRRIIDLLNCTDEMS